VSFLSPIWNYVDALVPTAAQQDALTAARYRAFIALRLIGSLAALATLPVYLVLRGVPSGIEIAIFAWLVTPILLVHYLARTGRYETAHILSALSLSGMAFVVALCTGGIVSFAAIWLVVVPLEAALSGSRRIVLVSAGLSTAASASLVALGAGGFLPQPSTEMHDTLTALTVILVSLYAAVFALGVEWIARKVTQLLEAGKDRYRLLAENTTEAVVRFTQSGSVRFASPAAETLFGVHVSNLAGNGLFDRVHVADRPAFLTALADVAEFAEERTLEFRIQRDVATHGPGQFVWIQMRGKPLDRPAPGNQNKVVIAVLRDVSERKAQREAIDSASLESERANAAKNHFIAATSHELRTPLNAIIGFSGMLMDNSVKISSADKAEYVKLINASGRHLLSIVNGMLDAAKIEAGHFKLIREPFAPGPVIENCVDLFALQAREGGIELRLRVARNLPEIAADKRAVNQILINIISNAIKFTPRGGVVTIGATSDGPELAVTVEDTGVGIGRDDLPRLGEKFFQARSSSEGRHDGSGLGLSIVKDLVKLHDGKIDIRSQLGEGTHITFRLPFSAAEARSSNAPTMKATEGPRNDSYISKNWVKKSA
jgi:cell cycle sensor histidine kinase DivJ